MDTSALIAILSAEAEAVVLRNFMDAEPDPTVSAATLHEAFCVSIRTRLERGSQRLERLISLLNPEIVPFDDVQLDAAKVAYHLYGRGSGHLANLNMGDCFAYALAKTFDLPLLFKGNDFVHTDVKPALTWEDDE